MKKIYAFLVLFCLFVPASSVLAGDTRLVPYTWVDAGDGVVEDAELSAITDTFERNGRKYHVHHKENGAIRVEADSSTADMAIDYRFFNSKDEANTSHNEYGGGLTIRKLLPGTLDVYAWVRDSEGGLIDVLALYFLIK